MSIFLFSNALLLKWKKFSFQIPANSHSKNRFKKIPENSFFPEVLENKQEHSNKAPKATKSVRRTESAIISGQRIGIAYFIYQSQIQTIGSPLREVLRVTAHNFLLCDVNSFAYLLPYNTNYVDVRIEFLTKDNRENCVVYGPDRED